MSQSQELQNSKVDLFSTRVIDFKGRGIKNAIDATDQQDYVTLSQVGTLIKEGIPKENVQKISISIDGIIKNSTPGAVLYVGPNGTLAQDGTKFSYSNGKVTLSNTVLLSGLTASRPVKSDASKNLISGLIVLTTDVSGVLPAANGGTGLATITAFNVMVGNGTGVVSLVAPGTAGWVLTSNGAANPTFQVLPTSAVTSVFGRTGAVIAVTNDYSFSQISGTVASAQLPNTGPGAGTKAPIVSLTIDNQGRVTAWA